MELEEELPGSYAWGVEMELLIVIAALIVFDVAAWYWGVDSRHLSLERSDRPARSI